MTAVSYTDEGSLCEYFLRLRRHHVDDDHVLESLHILLDLRRLTLSELTPPYCLSLQKFPPRSFRGLSGPCPLLIRNAAGAADPTRLRALVRNPERPKPPAEPVRLHRWPEEENEPSPTPAAPPVPAVPPTPAMTPVPEVPVKVLRAKDWFEQAKVDNPMKRGELVGGYAHRLHALQDVAGIVRPWAYNTVLRRLHDKPVKAATRKPTPSR